MRSMACLVLVAMTAPLGAEPTHYRPLWYPTIPAVSPWGKPKAFQHGIQYDLSPGSDYVFDGVMHDPYMLTPNYEAPLYRKTQALSPYHAVEHYYSPVPQQYTPFAQRYRQYPVPSVPIMSAEPPPRNRVFIYYHRRKVTR